MTEPTITISEQSAKVLLRIAAQVQLPSAEGKIQVGMAQAELEKALTKDPH